MLARKQLLRLQDGVSRTELLALLHILHTVTDALAHHIAAKARDHDIAPCTCRVCRINDVLQHGFSCRTVQDFWQL